MEPTTMPPAPVYNNEVNPEPTPPMGKFEGSFKLFKASLRLLMKDSEIIFFPILNAITSVVVLAIFFFLYVTSNGGLSALRDSQVDHGSVGNYILSFILAIVLYFLAIFFEGGLATIVYGRIKGMDLSFSDGLKAAGGKWGNIFLWSVLSATVGLILRAISDRSRWLGKLAADILGAAWNIVNFFIVETLMLEDLSVSMAIRESANTFKKTWGETLIMNISLSIAIWFVSILSSIFFVGLFFIIGFGNVFGSIVSVLAFFAWFLFLSIFANTLSAVFRVVLYVYAKEGIIPEGFPPELIEQAISRT